MVSFDPDRIETPCHVVDLALLERNLQTLAVVTERAGCKILLALKGYATWGTFPLVRQYLHGAAASSLHEARLGREELGREVHACAPAYSESDLVELLSLADHVVFNSFSQWERFRPLALRHADRVQFGVRVNPEQSEVKTKIYDPCAAGSRLGVTRGAFRPDLLEGISGLHFHALFQSNADALERLLAAFEAKFGEFLPGLSWVNFGGGHHVTRAGYDLERLVRILSEFRARRGLEVYLEPGEAVALDAGVLVASVLDVVETEMPIAILDTSASAHMPDVLEMPYRPEILGADAPGKLPYTFRLGGLTCLAGDVIGDYSFAEPLRVGSRVVFTDMAHYSTVKSTTFNGVRLPSIALRHRDGRIEVVRRFGYEDYRNRLG